MEQVNTCSGIQNPGMAKDSSKSEPHTSMTLRDSTRSTESQCQGCLGQTNKTRTNKIILP